MNREVPGARGTETGYAQGVAPENEAFSRLVAELDYAMYIVTTAAEGERAGCLVGFATQTSIEPSRFTVWLSDANRTAQIAAHASTFVVHVLREGDLHLARHFGGETGDDVDKFASVPHREGPDGVPVLTQCDWFAGRVVARMTGAGDHTAYVLEPIDGERRHAGRSTLGFQRVRHVSAGHPAGQARPVRAEERVPRRAS